MDMVNDAILQMGSDYMEAMYSKVKFRPFKHLYIRISKDEVSKEEHLHTHKTVELQYHVNSNLFGTASKTSIYWDIVEPG